MLTLSDPGWMVPLASQANLSVGMIGKYPFWYRSRGESRIAFAGMGLGADKSGFAIQEMREVEKRSDSTVSPVEPLSIQGGLVREILLGLSRDDRWALMRKEEFLTGWVDRRDYLVPADRLADTAFLARRDSLLPFSTGLNPSLNPFEASESNHTDYYLTLPFQVFGGERLQGSGFPAFAAHRWRGGPAWIPPGRGISGFATRTGGLSSPMSFPTAMAGAPTGCNGPTIPTSSSPAAAATSIS